ncbi:MAG: DUF4349 domain-containing protein [Anaerolineae bacterium]
MGTNRRSAWGVGLVLMAAMTVSAACSASPDVQDFEDALNANSSEAETSLSASDRGAVAGAEARQSDLSAPGPGAAPEGLAPPVTGGGEAVAAVATALPVQISFPGESSRKIIKDGDISLEVDNVQGALSRVGSVAAGSGGYVLKTSTDFGDGRRAQATVTMAVPSLRFEDTLERIRGIGEVMSESSTGSDVSQEYVDLQSEIANLEATQARVRSFLDQATTVEEALRVNARLTEIEGQISQRKGRLQFLEQRAAFSTITVTLLQAPPDVTPTATATPTPRPAWNPQETAGDAIQTLTIVLQGLATAAIWLAIVFVPLGLPVAAVAWHLSQRRRKGGRGDGED